MANSWFKPGQWNAVCDICGFRFKSDELRKNWKGEMVCQKDFELRHPQEFVRVKPERIGVPWARPEVDIQLFICWIWAITAYADLAEADCAQADNTAISFISASELKFGSADGPLPTTPNPFCTMTGVLSIAGLGTSGCLLPSKVS